jgi:glucokinase
MFLPIAPGASIVGRCATNSTLQASRSSTILRQPSNPCRIWRTRIRGRSVAGAQGWALRWQFLGRGPGLAWPDCCPMIPGRSLLQAKCGPATLLASSHREDAILEYLHQRFGHVSAERALSGPWLEKRAVPALDEMDAPLQNALRSPSAFQGDLPNITRRARYVLRRARRVRRKRGAHYAA